MRLTTASFFSGCGGMDAGLERAGWEVVSFSEIDPYASAVLARHWPEVPNLGDIVKVRDGETGEADLAADAGRETGRREGTAALGGHEFDASDRERGRVVSAGAGSGQVHGRLRRSDGEGGAGWPTHAGGEPDERPFADGDDWRDATGVRLPEQRGSVRGRRDGQSADAAGLVGPTWRDATLWTGGFPCQDLSVAGKRAGLAGARSGLAFTFLDLVERHRPRAILLENVPGLLSSNGGRDMAALLGALVDLGYGVGYRVLDAQFFGVPQRRRRVFILGLRGGPGDPLLDLAAERAAEVLSVGTGCERHPAKGGTKRKGAADRFADGVGGAGALPQSVTSKWFRGSIGPAGDEHHNLILGSGAPADPGGVRGASGLPGGLHNRAGVVEPGQQQTFVKVSRPSGPEGLGERWAEAGVSPTLNNFDQGDSRAVTLIAGGSVAPTLTAPDARHRVVDGKRQDGSRLDRIPTIVQALDTKQGGADDNEAQAGHLDEVARSDGLDDPLLPLGLDSARYRVLGNAVAVPVAEWLGRRLAEHFRE